MVTFTPIRRILSNRRGNGLDEIRAQYGIEPCGFDSHWPENERTRTTSESAPTSARRARDTPPSSGRARDTPPSSGRARGTPSSAGRARGNVLDEIRAQYDIQPCGFDSHWPENERTRVLSRSRSHAQFPSHPSPGLSSPAPVYDDAPAPPPYSPGLGYSRRTASNDTVSRDLGARDGHHNGRHAYEASSHSRARPAFVSDRPTNYDSYNRAPQASTSGSRQPTNGYYDEHASYNRHTPAHPGSGSRYYRN